MVALALQRDRKSVDGTVTWILASSSPRRAALLAAAGQRFTVEPSRVDEKWESGEPAGAFAARMARVKALEVARRTASRWVLGADTVVVVDDQPLGKPRDAMEAVTMLKTLSGRTHGVITAFALVDPYAHVFAEQIVESHVQFRVIRPREIDAYVRSGEPFDKAGAYAIQGRAAEFVARLDGSLTNVIGLPVEEVEQTLRSAGLWRVPSTRARS